MVNETLVYNLTQGIGDAFKNVIGVDSSFGLAGILIGMIVILIFIIWIFKSGAGMWGLAVIIPPLVIVLSSTAYGLGLLPAWLGVIVVMIVGMIYGLIILRVFREG